MATQDIITSDPLLLVPGRVGRMSALAASVPVEGRSGDASLVWARTRECP